MQRQVPRLALSFLILLAAALIIYRSGDANPSLPAMGLELDRAEQGLAVEPIAAPAAPALWESSPEGNGRSAAQEPAVTMAHVFTLTPEHRLGSSDDHTEVMVSSKLERVVLGGPVAADMDELTIDGRRFERLEGSLAEELAVVGANVFVETGFTALRIADDDSGEVIQDGWLNLALRRDPMFPIRAPGSAWHQRTSAEGVVLPLLMSSEAWITGGLEAWAKGHAPAELTTDAEGNGHVVLLDEGATIAFGVRTIRPVPRVDLVIEREGGEFLRREALADHLPQSDHRFTIAELPPEKVRVRLVTSGLASEVIEERSLDLRGGEVTETTFDLAKRYSPDHPWVTIDVAMQDDLELVEAQLGGRLLWTLRADVEAVLNGARALNHKRLSRAEPVDASGLVRRISLGNGLPTGGYTLSVSGHGVVERFRLEGTERNNVKVDIPRLVEIRVDIEPAAPLAPSDFKIGASWPSDDGATVNAVVLSPTPGAFRVLLPEGQRSLTVRATSPTFGDYLVTREVSGSDDTVRIELPSRAPRNIALR